MKIAGVIAEYNPFHLGHAYHLQKTHEVTGADFIVAVMSGDFVQRGEPALVDKFTRTRMALEAGVDAVIELPVINATAGADDFARAGVGLLASIGVTDIVYGSETPDRIEEIRQIAELDELPFNDYSYYLSQFMESGMNYPKASREAVKKLLPGSEDLLDYPNNILAIEYEKEIIKWNLELRTHATNREGLSHYDTNDKLCKLVSGSNIRQMIENADESYKSLLPDTTANLLNYSISLNDFASLIKYKILISSAKELSDIYQVNEDIANLIKNNIELLDGDVDDFVRKIYPKNITESSIKRALIHILLDIKYEEVIESENGPAYARVLGFNEKSGVMKALKQASKVDLITKLSKVSKKSYLLDERASLVYNSVVWDRWHISPPNDYKINTIIV